MGKEKEKYILFGSKHSIHTQSEENVILDEPYVDSKTFGCTVGLLSLHQLNTVLSDKSIKYVEIEKTSKNPLVSTTSLQMLDHNGNEISASYCHGQNEIVYNLKQIINITKCKLN